MPVTALGDVAKAALASKLAEVHGPWAVYITAREALVVYLAARGEGISELPWDLDVANESAWEARWASRLRDSGITSESDKTDLVGWLRAAHSPSTGGSAAAAGPARTALRALESAGVVINEVQRAAVEQAMATSKGR